MIPRRLCPPRCGGALRTGISRWSPPRCLDSRTRLRGRGSQRATSPFFSPDGQWIGFFADNNVKKISIASGIAQTLAIDAGRLSWRELGNDDSIVFSNGSGELRRVPAVGGISERVTTVNSQAGETSHRWPEILPGGKALLFVAHAGGISEQRLMIRMLDTGETRVLDTNVSSPHYSASGHLLFARADVLMAAPFDVGHLRMTASLVPVVEGVAMSVDKRFAPG